MDPVRTTGKIPPAIGGVPADKQVVTKSPNDETKALQKNIGSYQKKELAAVVAGVAAGIFGTAAALSGVATGAIAYVTVVVILAGAVAPSLIAFSPLLIGAASLTAATAFCLFFGFISGHVNQSKKEMYNEMRFIQVFDQESMIKDFNAGESTMNKRLMNFPFEMREDLLNFKRGYDRLVGFQKNATNYEFLHLYHSFRTNFEKKAYEIYQRGKPVTMVVSEKGMKMAVSKKKFLENLQLKMGEVSRAKQLTILETIIKNPGIELRY